MLIEMYSLDVSSIKTLFKALGIYFPQKYKSHNFTQPILPDPDFCLNLLFADNRINTKCIFFSSWHKNIQQNQMKCPSNYN